MNNWKEKTDGLRMHQPSVIGFDKCKQSAVCIPLVRRGEEICVLFEKRSARIDRQPGDICFPGGMVEQGETTEEAAVRELCEELLVRPEQVEVLGMMDICAAGSILIYPYAVILNGYEGSFSEDEVETTFCVPLSYLMEHEPEQYTMDFERIPSEDFPYHRIQGGRNYKWRHWRETSLFYEYEGHTIWGLTARILESFVEIYRKIS